jgi:hypothetical protein
MAGGSDGKIILPRIFAGLAGDQHQIVFPERSVPTDRQITILENLQLNIGRCLWGIRTGGNRAAQEDCDDRD